MLRNRTPYAAERNWTRGKRGEHLWIVAVKATFRLDGALALSDEQVPPVLAPEYAGDPGASSLLYESDLLAVKRNTDVLVNGSAHAPGARAAPRVVVSLRAGDVQKSLLVHGGRFYDGAMGGVGTSAARPFVTQPVVYESAFGGSDLTAPDPRQHRIDMRNPIGRGVATAPYHLSGRPAHTIEYPSGDPAATGPAGFGTVDRAWSPRMELAGTYDETWAATRKPLLAEDYDDRRALAAPADQQPAAYFRGGERVELTNMTPSGSLRFDLPRVGLGFVTQFGSRREEHAARLTAVIVEPDVPRLFMVWQTALTVPARLVEHLDRTTIQEKQYLS